jgi:hypothetical protein
MRHTRDLLYKYTFLVIIIFKHVRAPSCSPAMSVGQCPPGRACGGAPSGGRLTPGPPYHSQLPPGPPYLSLPVRMAYQPPASSTFLSQQTSTSHQPPANRTGSL